MAVERGWSWCPHCRKWVPEEKMNYDTESGLRVCTPCLDGTSDRNKYVYDEHHEDVRCVYCNSYNTIELKPDWGHFKCQECGEEFRRL